MSLRNIAISLLDRAALARSRNKHLLNGTWRYQTSNILTLWTSLKAYLRDEFTIAHGFPHGKGLGTIEVPIRGASSVVFFVTIGEQKRVVRLYPVREQLAAETHRDALSLLEQHGVRAPRLVHSLADLKKYHAIFTAEEFVEGKPCFGKRIDEAALRAIAVQIARLHSITRRHRGPLNVACHSPASYELELRIRRLFSALLKCGLATQSDWASILEWSRSWWTTIDRVPHFSLTHGDIHANNGLLTPPDDEYCLLDLNKLSWGFAAKDVMRLRDKICDGNDQRFEIFEKPYLELLHAESRAVYETTKPFFFALHEMEVAAVESKRIPREGAKFRTQAPEVASQDAWTRFLELLKLRP